MTADRVLLLVGLSVVVLGLSSKIVKKHALSPVLLAVGVGVLVGPRLLDRHVLLEQLARVALAMSVVDIALRLRPSDLRASAVRLAVLLGVVMPGMWLVTAWGASLLLGLPVAVALLLAACLTPTDPGVASALVTGTLPNRCLPRRVRMSLQGEAAANDGLALPFVLLSGLLATMPVGEALAAPRLTGTGPLSSGFIGWSGPLGDAGIYYLAFAHRYELPDDERLFLAGTLAITVSIVGQALTATAAVGAYRRSTGAEDPGEELELAGRLP